MKVLGVICALAFFLQGARAATVVYNWAITWVEASPDGFKRPVIGSSSPSSQPHALIPS
jgi:hypothetical protein